MRLPFVCCVRVLVGLVAPVDLTPGAGDMGLRLAKARLLGAQGLRKAESFLWTALQN